MVFGRWSMVDGWWSMVGGLWLVIFFEGVERGVF
jgi:hypothetical protein